MAEVALIMGYRWYTGDRVLGGCDAAWVVALWRGGARRIVWRWRWRRRQSGAGTATCTRAVLPYAVVQHAASVADEARRRVGAPRRRRAKVVVGAVVALPMACGEQVGHCELVWSDAAGKVAAGGGDARLRVGGDWRRRWGGVAIDEVEIERYDADHRGKQRVRRAY